MRVRFLWPFLVFGCLLMGPAHAIPSLKILAKQVQAKSHGMSETCYTIGFNGWQKPRTSPSSSKQVKIIVEGPTHPGMYAPVPVVYTNQDASLMVIQSMPHWVEKHAGWSLCLVIAMPDQSIKVVRDFSVRLNRLALANVSHWQNVNRHFHRPASDIFVSSVDGRKIYVNQYTTDPEVGLPEYITLGAEIAPSGDLKFLSYASQGF